MTIKGDLSDPLDDRGGVQLCSKGCHSIIPQNWVTFPRKPLILGHSFNDSNRRILVSLYSKSDLNVLKGDLTFQKVTQPLAVIGYSLVTKGVPA